MTRIKWIFTDKNLTLKTQKEPKIIENEYPISNKSSPAAA